jgi:tRNA A-37 threonylcarbamoyl transferase component Bud32/tetratricopeptide (TPR) repeat protein
MDLRDQLQATLSGNYTLERELAGGGMSRVFVAEELRLKRKVVVKVLPPELAQGISVERFEREIQTVAALQQANIVPVLTAGDTNGLPFYTMPFVEGESLRARLGRGTLTVTQLIGVLRDVARALSYAHERGVVHRDIKPDNVLMSGGAAVVTDFGIAKAISAARTASGIATLTQIGTSIGTPAYMAPEQAAGDPELDRRADIYSLGAMAYELAAGQVVFANRTPQRMVAAHMSETPVSIASVRADLPAPLAELIMSCLAKDPDARPQNADDIARILDTITSGGGVQSMPSALVGGPGMFMKALAIYAAAFVAVAILAKAAIVGIGLPDWVFPGALVVMALGLPVVLWTGYVQRVTRRALTATPTFTPGGSPSEVVQGTFASMAIKAAPKMSWYRTARGGAYALGAFVAIVAAFMAMRALGIGPAGSLTASGAIKSQDQLVIADFSGAGGDTLLARALTEAIRTDLRQSDIMRVVPVSVVNENLRLMGKPAATAIDTGIARVIAIRAGVKAVLGGDIALLGTSYVLTARLITPSSGDVLAAFRETAADQSGLLPAVERLSRSLRAKLGESLRRIQAEAPLDRVTTSSLDALRLYAQGIHVGDDLGDVPRGKAMLLEAVGKDSTFAMAWRKLGAWSNNIGDPIAAVYAKKAVDNADHLTTRERYTALGSFHTTAGAGFDAAEALASYRLLLEDDSTDAVARVNAAIQLSALGQLDSAIVYARRALQAGNTYARYHLPAMLLEAGRMKEADSLIADAHRAAPGFPYRSQFDVNFDEARGQYDSAEAHAGGPAVFALVSLASVQMIRGRFRAATATFAAIADSAARAGNFGQALDAVATASWIESTYRNHPAVAAAALQAAEAKYPIDKQPTAGRPYYQLAAAYANAGRADRARRLIREGDENYSPGLKKWFLEAGAIANGLTLLADKRPRDAIVELQRGRCGGTSPRNGVSNLSERCPQPFLADAYVQAGDTAAAQAALERYLNTNGFFHGITDPIALGPSLQLLGELYEAKGNREGAAKQYARLIDIWKDADPELQPRVAELRRRLAKLTPVERLK